MIVFRKSKKKILSFISIILGTSFIFAPINYLFEKTNNLTISNSNFSQSKDVRTNNDDVKLSYDNRNSDNESPNGVVNILEDELVFTSWFNQEVWRYNPKGSDENNTIIRQFFGKDNLNSLNGLRVKYNVYNDTFLIYGTINKGGLYAFIIQVDANTGKEIIVNEKANNSLWASRQIGEIGHIILNEANGSMIILPKFSKFSKGANTLIGRCDSSTYTPIWSKFSSLTSANDFTYNENNDIAEAFYIDENIWGFTYFIKGNQSTLDKYQYFFFDNNLTFLMKSGEIAIGSTGAGGNSSLTVGKPLIFPFLENSIKKYRIIDASLVPIYNLENYNDTFINGSDYLRYHTFVPQQNKNQNPTFSSSTQALSNFVVYQLKKDAKNNVFYISGFEKKSNNTTNFSKNKIAGFKVNNNNGTITKASTELVETYTNQKVVTNISIINDKFNKNTKTALIKEVKNYGKNITSPLQINTPINALSQYRYLITPSDNSQINNKISWTKLSKTDYKTKINDSIKQKLASDVLENDILNLVEYKNGQDVATYIKNELDELNLENGYKLTETRKVLFNNEEGTIKSKVKSNIKKWWYEENDNSINSTLIDYTNIEITGFYVINDLIFKLVTSSNVDNSKWNKIQNTYINKVLPSTITNKNILDDFIVKGPKIVLTENDVNIINVDINNYKKESVDNKKSIEVLVSDKSGTLTIIYDLKTKSSISMEHTNVIGSYSYIGFLHSALNVPIKFNEEKFNSLKKTKLANQFSKKDLLNVLEVSSLYDTSDPEKWELTYVYDKSSEEYKKNLLNGKANFTFKYKKDANFPTNIEENHFTINVRSMDVKNDDTIINGDNCLKLSDYIFSSEIKTIATFDQENANLLTGIKNLDEVKNNIDSLLLQTLNITNGIFKLDQINVEFDELNSSSKKALFNLSFKNGNIISEINVVSKDGTLDEKLIFDKYIRDEINKLNESYFELPKITFNYSLVEFDWNYEFKSDNNFLELSFDELVKKVNEDRINSNKNSLNFRTSFLPSEFVNYFKNKEKEFHTYFPLIANKNSNNKLRFNQLIDTKDPSYYEISKIQMIANDANGTINIRYEIIYPNLSTVSQVYVNPEVKLTGLKSKSFTTSLTAILLTIFSIMLIFLIIGIPLFILMKRHRFLNSNLGKKEKRNKLKSSYVKKVTKK